MQTEKEKRYQKAFEKWYLENNPDEEDDIILQQKEKTQEDREMDLIFGKDFW